MNEARTPELSVILVTPDSYATVRTTIRYLLRQHVLDRMELVLVAPREQDLQLDTKELSGFLAYQIVEVGTIQSIAYANTAGVRRARAPIVVLAEDHAFPAPGWGEALLKAHQAECAAVGPVVRNANPRSIVSWADLLIAYAPWLYPGRAGRRDHLPGHNSSYKKEILLAYGSELEPMLEAESVLHWDLRQKGHTPALGAGGSNRSSQLWAPILLAASSVLQWARLRLLPGSSLERRQAGPLCVELTLDSTGADEPNCRTNTRIRFVEHRPEGRHAHAVARTLCQRLRRVSRVLRRRRASQT